MALASPKTSSQLVAGTRGPAIQFNPEDLVWKEGPPTLPRGTKVAVLEGDPKKTELFTMRLRIPAGFKILPHWHPRDERVTVLSGSVHVGFGDVFDVKRGKFFRAGAYYVNPPKRSHFVWFDEEAVLQLTGMGPWEMHFLDQPNTPKRESK